MKKFNNLDDFDAGAQKGDWFIFENQKGTFCAIRFGETAFKGTVIIPISINPDPNKVVWRWDGNLEKPTLSPSILVKAVPGWNDGWHGWLRDGVLVSA